MERRFGGKVTEWLACDCGISDSSGDRCFQNALAFSKYLNNILDGQHSRKCLTTAGKTTMVLTVTVRLRARFLATKSLHSPKCKSPSIPQSLRKRRLPSSSILHDSPPNRSPSRTPPPAHSDQNQGLQNSHNPQSEPQRPRESKLRTEML